MFKDKYTKFRYSSAIKQKSDVEVVLRQVVAHAKTLGHGIVEMLSDNDGEFGCKVVKEILAENEITHKEHTILLSRDVQFQERTREYEGKAELRMRDIKHENQEQVEEDEEDSKTDMKDALKSKDTSSSDEEYETAVDESDTDEKKCPSCRKEEL